jgi:hypothetical protein
MFKRAVHQLYTEQTHMSKSSHRILALTSAACLILAFGCVSLHPRYTYSDGSGTTWVITRNHETIVENIPVKPANGSSSIYDGGKQAMKKIREADYALIRAAIERAAENASIRIKNRVMGSGLIIVRKGMQEKTCIIGPGSEEQRDIERMLHDIMR